MNDLSDEAFYAAKDGESFDAENVKRYLRQNDRDAFHRSGVSEGNW